ncbi:MAG: chromosomal replication initiator protein DnaA [Spirochaetes bacterium]|nr:chromosomal replication initiator protein DnaA [Spirochaetota bacterium]
MSDMYSMYWDGVKKELESVLSQNEMFMWINRIDYDQFNINEKKMTLAVPSNFIKDNILKYQELITDTLNHISGYQCSVEFKIDKAKPEMAKVEKSAVETPESKTSTPHPQIITSPANEVKNIPFPPLSTNQPGIMNPQSEDENYTFESFIIGSSNEFAAHAAKAVAENPGTKYNPYFIWGESGLGKTHLLKAIAKHIREYFPTKKAKYVSSEEFTNDFVNSLKSSAQEKFRIKYRQLDVLLIDDVQFFANKEGIQGEFFHTFNKLYDNHKQMIFSCDQPIYKVKKMEARLKGRFSMGLTVDLRPPDFELRMAILETLSDTYGLTIKNDAMEYICTNIEGNIRDLKGAFKDLLAYSSIMNIETITLDIVMYRLKEKITVNIYTSSVSVDKIIHMVGEYYDVKTQEIIGNKRTKSIALARQIAMYLSRKLTRLSTTQIGTYFGNKEHGTVMHATKKIEDLTNTDSKIKGDIEHLINKIKSE